MANVLVENKSLEDIAAAIRGKNGESTTYTPGEMAGAITNLPEGGGDGPTPEELTFTGNCEGLFKNGKWDWFITKYGNKITTNYISNCKYMFSQCKVDIPFELKFSSSIIDTGYMFDNFLGKHIPKIKNCKPENMLNMFNKCWNIREYPVDIETYFDWSYIDNLNNDFYGDQSYVLGNNYSLRKLPYGLLKHGNPACRYNYTIYKFEECVALDEIVDLPNPYRRTWYKSAFTRFVDECGHLSRLTFAKTMTDGQPNNPKWSGQMIDLSNHVGYTNSYNIINYNSGITMEKLVNDDTTYQQLKNDPDWFSLSPEYSRYNYTSAVETINSLPDTSAFIAENGGTNTIKFKGDQGSKTDGGAINKLTPEQIAVAASKGWTVAWI